MKISIDLGGSTIDLVAFDKNNNIQKKTSFESNKTDRNDIFNILEKAEIKLQNISKLRITGGFSLNLPKKINGLEIEKIDEFDANGYGGKYLAQTEKCLVVSLGTGTSMVKVINGKIKHIGGTGIGGGTLIGLGKLILNENNYSTIDQLAQKGTLQNIDLSVQDIVGGKIGMLPRNATASNFGKVSMQTAKAVCSKHNEQNALACCKKADLALGICNLIGETIGSIAYFASQKYQLEKIVLIGKVTRVKSILKIIQTTSKIYNKKIIVPHNADFGTAIGAGLVKVGRG